MTDKQTQTRQHWGNTSFGTGVGMAAIAFACIFGIKSCLEAGDNSDAKVRIAEIQAKSAPQVQYADLNNDGTNEAFYTINGQVATVAPEYTSRQR
jgi:hypothetical protein